MYQFHVVADDYPVRADGFISREITKKEKLGDYLNDPSDGSPVQQQCRPYNPRCHERDDTQQLNYLDGSQSVLRLETGARETVTISTYLPRANQRSKYMCHATNPML